MHENRPDTNRHPPDNMNDKMMDGDYNIARMEQIVQKAQGGKALSQEQKAEIARFKERHDAALAAVRANVRRLEEEAERTRDELARAHAEVKFAESAAELLADPGRLPRSGSECSPGRTGWRPRRWPA